MTRREDYLGLQVICSKCEVEIENTVYISNGHKFCRDCKDSIHPFGYATIQISKPDNELFSSKVMRTYDEARNILLSKHKDYGPLNIANAPGGALNGLRVRMHDKTARINHLIDNAKYKNPEHESLRDSFLDLANYAMIALLVIDGNWPTSDSGPDCD